MSSSAESKVLLTVKRYVTVVYVELRFGPIAGKWDSAYWHYITLLQDFSGRRSQWEKFAHVASLEGVADVSTG